ncbi:hypothetical protein ACOMHN_001779 [Nucella lapillus]
MNELAIVGKRFQDAGLSDLCIESGLLAEGSVAGVFEGRVYKRGMTNLAADYPEIYQAFKEGNFAVQLKENKPFGRIPVDQTTEVTVNKDTQTVGGTTKFSMKPGAVGRYYLTAENRSAFPTKLRNMVDHSRRGADHPDLQKSRLRKDEESVTLLEETLASWTNPFEDKQDLMNIATGTAAPKEIAEDLKRAHEKGEAAYIAFRRERLEYDEKTFHSPMKKISLKTFGSTANRRKTKCADGRTIIIKADRWLFGRMIVMGQSRNLNMKDLMCFPLGPLPWSLAAPDGTLRKTNKAALATNIKKSTKMAESVPAHSATIIDGMGLVQRANFDGQQPTFEEVADRIFSMAVSEAAKSDRLDIVFDTYKKLSIKYNERTNRSVTSGLRNQNIASGQKIKQWRKFLSQESNKVTLIKYLVHEWDNEEKYFQKLGRLHKVLYVTCEDKCYRFSAIQRREVPELQSFHEEADGRLILHATHAAEDGYGGVIEKLTALKILKSDQTVQKAFADLGKDWKISPELFEKLEEFTCKLYAPKQLTTAVNSLRYQLFCAKSGDIESHQLPPCQNFLWKHAQRANYQAGLWQRCLSCDPEAPDPVQHGWRVETQSGEEVLCLDWMDVQPAPDAVLELLACKCPTTCTMETCVCLQHGLKCTNMCRVKNCDNQPCDDDIATEAASIDEDDEDDE